MWFQSCQRTSYSEEFQAVSSGSSTKRLPVIRQLGVFLCDDGLLRCGGRIRNAHVSYSTRHPVLLPAAHHLTILLIREVHAKILHSGVNATLSALRQFVWIPRGRQRVKSILSKCVTCRRVSGRPFPMPPTASLPSYRITPTFPFNVTGVDYTGMLGIKTPTGRDSVYICLFTCAVSRALHLELVPDLSADSFLRAFRRFISRRSRPRLMLSDNASTFHGAASTLKQLTSDPTITDSLTRLGVEWKFIPARAPWFGGFWERLIGLTKTTLRKTLGRAFVSFDVLHTLLTEVEAVLNDRPLTYQTNDISDSPPLSPSVLLHGRQLTTVPHPTVDDNILEDPDFQPPGHAALSRLAEQHSLLLQHFWSQWTSEYLTALREHHSLSQSQDARQASPVRVGTVVLIHDETPRLQWKSAVVTRLLPSADGIVRTVELRTSTGLVTTRPVARLYPLEVSGYQLNNTGTPVTQRSTVDTSSDLPSSSSDSHLPIQPRRAAATNADVINRCILEDH